jgi:hypothetical protein
MPFEDEIRDKKRIERIGALDGIRTRDLYLFGVEDIGGRSISPKPYQGNALPG